MVSEEKQDMDDMEDEEVDIEEDNLAVDAAHAVQASDKPLCSTPLAASEKQSCSAPLATRIHRTMITKILPQLHHCLTQKVLFSLYKYYNLICEKNNVFRENSHWNRI